MPATQGKALLRRRDRDRPDAVGDDVDRGGDPERNELITLQRREREDARGAIQVRPAERTDIEPLLERLQAPIREERRVEGAVRMIEGLQPMLRGGVADLQVERVEGVVRVQDRRLRQGPDLFAKAK